MKVTLRFGERTRTARVVRRGDQIHVAFEDGSEATLSAQRTNDGGVVFLPVRDQGSKGGSESGTRRAILLRDADERHLWLDGRTHTYRRIEAGDARELGGSGGLAATIPAVVLEVLVESGQTVEEGEKLILLESMKMVMPILAPHSGTVTGLHCAAGDSVAPGVPLVEVEPQ